jgi:hypothetical protein
VRPLSRKPQDRRVRPGGFLCRSPRGSPPVPQLPSLYGESASKLCASALPKLASDVRRQEAIRVWDLIHAARPSQAKARAKARGTRTSRHFAVKAVRLSYSVMDVAEAY